MTDQITVPRETWDALREALELAMENLRPHGDHCFLHDVGEYNACFCGKDSLVDHLQSVVESAALTAAASVSHAKPETAPVTEGLAITSESVLALLVKEMRYIATITNGPAHRIAMMTLEKVAAANAVSDQDLPIGKCGVLSKSEPQAQGEAKLPVYFAQYEYAPDFSVVVSVYRRRADDVPELIHSEALPKQIDAHPQATEPAEKEDPLQGAVDWLLQADGKFFAVATVQRTLRIGYNRAKRLADTARERAAAPEAKQ